MRFSDDEIVIEPGHCARTWQSCNYVVRGQHLFHERTYVNTRPASRRAPTLAESLFSCSGSLDRVEQWFHGLGTQKEIEELAAKHGGEAIEEFHPGDPAHPLYLLSFDDTDKAIAFARTDDFDLLCLTMAKAA